ncbi:hypothetical protein M5K25_006780 [Dendrobium thyrsiflorum]|uniref:Uncharacterized protein n=1 Tax=Dendrobium thyrsiflorum TaxID=117978 RepID=A0ABD0VCH6_DENTH
MAIAVLFRSKQLLDFSIRSTFFQASILAITDRESAMAARTVWKILRSAASMDPSRSELRRMHRSVWFDLD